ncbi:E3 ubiquitin-protein ligase XIAP-like [Argopecten irradians]|uniref:E3 ubiquitin-protein ligase XIAP-like n=1 Tax=Argopecten irradians TaxID=31199 RepID=UPI003719C6EA
MTYTEENIYNINLELITNHQDTSLSENQGARCAERLVEQRPFQKASELQRHNEYTPREASKKTTIWQSQNNSVTTSQSLSNNQGTHCTERLLEQRPFQEATELRRRNAYTSRETLTEKVENSLQQLRNSYCTNGQKVDTRRIAECSHALMPDTKCNEIRTVSEVKRKITKVRIPRPPVFPRSSRNHSQERISRISGDIVELRDEIRKLCEKAHIPLFNKSEKKTKPRKCKGFEYVVTLANETGGVCLEQMPNAKGRHKDKSLVNDLKSSLKKAKQWSIIHKGNHVKEMKQRKRARERKIKSTVIKSLKKHWSKTTVTEKNLDQDGNKMAVQHSKLRDIIGKLCIHPETLSIQVYPVSRSLDPYFQSLENGNTSSNASNMHIEWLRLNSFGNSSRRLEVSPIFLARAGFYHTGREDEVQCYSCGFTYRNWNIGDDPIAIHRRMSPTCSHVTGEGRTDLPIQRGEVEIPRNQRPQTEERAEPHDARLDTYIMQENPSIPEQEVVTSQENTRFGRHNGIQTTGNMFVHQVRELPVVRSPNDAQSHTDRQIINQHLPNHQRPGPNSVTRPNGYLSPIQTHNQSHRADSATSNTEIRSNDAQRMLKGTSIRPNQQPTNGIANGTGQQDAQSPRNGQRSSTGVSTNTMKRLIPLGVNFDKPKYPAFAVLHIRMSSYKGWSCSQAPQLMADAGFVYAGYADYTRCFFCGGGLRNWEDGDDPWIEHARWFPKCAYLQQNKGIEFIQLVHEELSREQQQGNVSKTEPAKDESVHQRRCQKAESIEEYSLPAYQSLLENGYDKEKIDLAFRSLRNKGQQLINAVTIVDEIHRLGDNQGNDDEITVMDDETSNAEDQEMKELRALVEENMRLKREKLCRICEEEDASIAFLPCAHLVCCQVCSQAVRKCPVCGKVIQGTVKTWLG